MPEAEREKAGAGKAAAAGSAEPTRSRLLSLLRSPSLPLPTAKPRKRRVSSEARTAFEQVAGGSLLASRRG